MTDQMHDEQLEREISKFLAWQAEDVAGAPTATEIAARISSRAGTRALGPAIAPQIVWVLLVVLLMVALIGAAVVGASLLRDDPSPVIILEPSPVADPSTRTAWTTTSAAQDWPVPPRLEPNAEPFLASALSGQALCTLPADVLASVVFDGVERCSHGPFEDEDPQDPVRVYLDSAAEPGAEANSFLDLRAVGFSEGCWFTPATCVNFDVVERVGRPLPHPQDEWIAFGIVADTNGDGTPDFRYGIDNAAPDSGALGTQRMWRTDVLTGETRYWYVLTVAPTMDAFFPGDKTETFGPTTGSIYAHREDGSPFRFYVWASLIRGGQVVATDYAPDAGWLEAE
jgi:hypothetical protein